MLAAAVTQIVRQRREADCGIAALAMLLEVSYEDAYVEAVAVDKARCASGLYNKDVIRIAKRLGATLTPARAFDLDDDEGVLRVRWSGTRAKKNPGGHFVAVKQGLIFCGSDGTATHWKSYLDTWHGRPCTLLRLA